MYDDPRIQVDPQQAKQIAQIICGEIKASLDHPDNKRRYELAKRCENQYAQRSIWDERGIECNNPWPGAADYFIALTEWIVDAVWARVLSILFSQEPYMKAKGVEASDVEKQEAVTDFTDMFLREKVKVYENTNYFFKQLIKLPFAVLKYDTVSEYDSAMEMADAMVYSAADGTKEYILPDDPENVIKQAQFAQAGMMPAGIEKMWVEKDIPIHDGPKLQYIRFEDYVYAPTVKKGMKPYWEGDRVWFTLNDLSLKARQDKVITDSVEKIKLAVNYDDKTGAEKEIARRAQLVESFHWYGRLPFNKQNQIDFTDPEAIEQEVYCLVAFKEEELLQVMHWYHQRNPVEDRVYIRECFEETENFEGRSLTDKLYKTQKEINTLQNTIINNAMLAMQKIFVKRRTTVQGEEWEQPEVYPGAMWEETIPGEIRTLEVGVADLKIIGQTIQQDLLAFAEKISNISAWNLGSRDLQSKPTATEFAGVIQEGNIGREPFMQRCYKIMAKICKWTHAYNIERMPVGLERRILGDTGEPVYPTQENAAVFAQRGIKPYWETDDIAGQFDFVWQGTSLNSDREWNITVANDLQERYLPVPMVGQNLLATWNILRMGLQARGMKDWQNILPPKQAVVKEMQMMAQKSQMRKVAEARQRGALDARPV